MRSAYASILMFFLLGACLTSIGMFISSVTENQVTSAVVTLVIMLITYSMTSLASYVSTASSSSLIALSALALVLAAIVYLFTKNLSVAFLTAVALVGALLIAYAIDASAFSGLSPALMKERHGVRRERRPARQRHQLDGAAGVQNLHPLQVAGDRLPHRQRRRQPPLVDSAGRRDSRGIDRGGRSRDYQEETQMKRGKKLIVLACALAAVLVLYLGVTLVTRHISDKNAVTETQGTFAATSFTADDIRSIAWTNLGNEYTISKTDDGWTLDGHDGFRLNQDDAAAMADAVSALKATRRLDGGVEDSDYGLAEPTLTVKIALNNGSEITLAEGDKNDVTDAYYLRVTAGESVVYTVETDLQTAFDQKLADLFVKETLPSLSESAQRVVLTRADDEITLVCSTDDDGNAHWYEETADGTRALNDETAQTLYDTIRDFAWYELVEWNADADALSGYGFDAPTAVVHAESLNDDGETTVWQVEIGGEFSSSYDYVRLSGSATVYRMKNELRKLAAGYSYSDYADKTVLTVDAEAIESLTLTVRGEAHTLRIWTETVAATPATASEATSGEGTTVRCASLDGNEWSPDSYDEIVSRLLALEAEDALTSVPEHADEPVLTVSVQTADAQSDVSFSVSELDAEHSLILRSDGAIFQFSAADADALIRALTYALK